MKKYILLLLISLFTVNLKTAEVEFKLTDRLSYEENELCEKVANSMYVLFSLKNKTIDKDVIVGNFSYIYSALLAINKEYEKLFSKIVDGYLN